MIRKAVVPVAGLGTRLLPLTKSLPKEMLPVGRKPAIHHVVDELAEAGIDRILLITSRHKQAIENYFDEDRELTAHLDASGKTDLIEAIRVPDIEFTIMRQGRPAGNGDAVRLARSFIGDDPVVVAWGDAIVRCPPGRNVVHRMIETHQTRQACCTIAVEEVPEEKVSRYGIVRPVGEAGDAFPIDYLVEKPDTASAPSRYAVSARYVCNPDIVGALDRTPPGRGGELWLVDAIQTLLSQGKPVWCVRLGNDGKRYDIGNPKSYWEACADFALDDALDGAAFRDYLRKRFCIG
ncbi:MAG: NTP transferase domain-containing protein [candidate division Zixibacteria bacterium]|nr:NTP transferase domain-containing protein [candidate division Zixibacteria bacterium]